MAGSSWSCFGSGGVGIIELTVVVVGCVLGLVSFSLLNVGFRLRVEISRNFETDECKNLVSFWAIRLVGSGHCEWQRLSQCLNGFQFEGFVCAINEH